MNVSPYLLIRDSDRHEILERIEDRVNDWASNWLPAAVRSSAESLSVVNNAADLAEVAATLRGYRFADAGSGRVACLKMQSTRRFANLLLATPGNDAALSLTDIERGLVDAALDDLARRLLGVDRLRTHDSQLRDADDELLGLLGPGASGVHCELAIGGISLSILLSPQGLHCVWSRRAMPSPEVTTTAIREALGSLNSGKVRIRAQLPAAEMTIADLASMTVGDVIHLNTRVDEHIAVQVGDSPHTLTANLGLAQGSRALQIVGVAAQDKQVSSK